MAALRRLVPIFDRVLVEHLLRETKTRGGVLMRGMTQTSAPEEVGRAAGPGSIREVAKIDKPSSSVADELVTLDDIDNMTFDEESSQSEFTVLSQDKRYVQYDDLPIVHVSCSNNNTRITAITKEKSTFYTVSAGMCGFKNARRGTNYAGQATAEKAAEVLRSRNIEHVRVCLKGVGPGREDALKGLEMGGLTIVSVTDVTPILHGGQRPKKRRRI